MVVGGGNLVRILPREMAQTTTLDPWRGRVTVARDGDRRRERRIRVRGSSADRHAIEVVPGDGELSPFKKSPGEGTGPTDLRHAQ